MAWIKTIPLQDAKDGLLKLYKRVMGPDGHLDHVLTIHSLRPHSLKGHLSLYKNVLHHTSNELPKWYLESLGVYVSKLNECTYCYTHHSAGLSRLLEDNPDKEIIINELLDEKIPASFDHKLREGMKYAQKLTQKIKSVKENDVITLREVGFNDGEILEINQVVSYFNYVNRSVLGLGVELETENIGLSPNNSDSEDWNHS